MTTTLLDLETEGGFTRAQVVALGRYLADNVATKADLGVLRAELRADMSELRADVRQELAADRLDLRKELEAFKVSTIKWMAGMLIGHLMATTALTVTLIRLLP
jgi:hypothetical protein